MGERQATLFSPEFNRRIEVEARPERLSADAGALVLRELMERLGLRGLLQTHLSDERDPSRIVHPLAELVLTWVLLNAQGWTDQVDVEALRDDPILRLAVSERRGDAPLREAGPREANGLCSQPTLSRLLQALAVPANRAGLGAVLVEWAEGRTGLGPNDRLEEVTLDLDSVPVEVHGYQPGSAYNGHFGMRCYHPVLVRWDRGDYLGAALRPGNAHTADGALIFVAPIVEWAQLLALRVWLRIDAGFPEPKLLSWLERVGVSYVARVRGNAVLERLAAPYLEQTGDSTVVGEVVALHELSYGAGSWDRERRVVLVIVNRATEQGELFREHFFLLTNATAEEVAAAELLERYRQRGTAEKDFGDWKTALELALSSTPRAKMHYREQPVTTPYERPDSFAANEARLLLSLLSANVLDAAAELLARHTRHHYSRVRFRQLLLKVAGRVLVGGRYITVVVNAAMAPLWSAWWLELQRAYPTRGSPSPNTLPSTA